MNVKALKTQLMGAVAMVIVAAVALSSSTYAWFAINTTVTASNMSVNVKSDSSYLVINTTGVAGVGETEEKTAVSGNIYPSAHTDAVTNKTTADVETNWYYKVADLPGASASSKDAQALTAGNYDSYVVEKNVYISMATGSNDTKDLKVTDCNISLTTGVATNIKPVKVVIASETGYVEYGTNADGDIALLTTDAVLADTVTAEVAIPVTIYVYYDGNHDDVYTNNVANLAGATVSVGFSVESASQEP